MKEYDNQIIDCDKLDFLRKNTMLGPIAILKIVNLIEEIEKFRKWYLKTEGELLDSNYTMANQLEYDLRFRIWETKCAPLWKKYSYGLGLSEFSEMVMDQQMYMIKNQSKKKTKKVSKC